MLLRLIVCTLARKILLHDRIKFAVAAAGVSISVMLVLVQIGLYLGFMQNASNLIDHSTADVWVMGEGNENFDFAGPIDERSYYQVASTPGVAKAERMLLAFGQFRMDDGGQQGVQVIGLDPGATMLVPWNLQAGDLDDLREPGKVSLDVSEFGKLRIDRIGARREISGVRAEVAVLTKGIRSFTTSPFRKAISVGRRAARSAPGCCSGCFARTATSTASASRCCIGRSTRRAPHGSSSRTSATPTSA